jgi:hypothetical protein
LQIERQRDAGTPSGHYFSATFDFRDPAGNRVSGNWRKDFSSEADAREFVERELPVGKRSSSGTAPKIPLLTIWSSIPGPTRRSPNQPLYLTRCNSAFAPLLLSFFRRTARNFSLFRRQADFPSQSSPIHTPIISPKNAPAIP